MSDNTRTINAQRLLDDLATLAQIGATSDGGVHRPALSSADMAARDWFKQRITAAGFRPRQDGAGSISAVWPAADPDAPTLVLGSHLDTVPHGGRFDGALGTLAALEVLRTVKEAGIALPVDLEAINFTNEEGAHHHMLGSRAIAGQIAADEFEQPHNEPAEFQAGLERAALTRKSILSARRDPTSIAGYLELHIEQGPRLEQTNLDIGVVTAIVGIRSLWMTFSGEAAHAGTKAMTERRDALWGAADFIQQARAIVLADFSPGTMNCGIIQAEPGAFNIVPGRVRLALEFRHGSEDMLDQMEQRLLQQAHEVARRYNLELAIESPGNVIAAVMDERVIQAVEAAADTLKLRHTRLLSFAGHDAQTMSIVAPAGMIFVPSIAGISHNPQEDTRDQDVVNGANVLLHAALGLANNL